MPKLNKNCVQCGSAFEAQRRNAKYCSDACKQSAARSRKLPPRVKCIGFLDESCPNSSSTNSRLKRCKPCNTKHKRFKSFPFSTIGAQIIRVIQRAKTTETFPDVTSIRDYAELCKTRTKANSIEWGESMREFSICHKVPLAHKEVVGLSTGANLFIGLQSPNVKASNRDYGRSMCDGTLYIERSTLQPESEIDPKTTPQEIMHLLLKRLGAEFLDYVVEANYSPRNTRAEISGNLCKVGDTPANVLGMEVLRHLGEENYELASNLIAWANHEKGHSSDSEKEDDVMVKREGSSKFFFSSSRWERVQYWLQTNMEFDIDPFYIDYEPEGGSETGWVSWEDDESNLW